MKDQWFIREALYEACLAAEHGDVPIGCVIVKNDTIIARAHNERQYHHDPTAHAEILALQRAGKYLKDWRLEDCILYVTHEPCPMCAGAAVMAKIHTIVYGADEPLTGVCGSQMNLVQFPGFPHQVRIRGPIAQEVCQSLVRAFFEQKRS